MQRRNAYVNAGFWDPGVKSSEMCLVFVVTLGDASNKAMADALSCLKFLPLPAFF